MGSRNRLAVRMRRAWIDIANRLGFQKTGLKKLKQEVRTCEYEDVRVLWDMLNKADALPMPTTVRKEEEDQEKYVLFV